MKYPITFMLLAAVFAFDLTLNHEYWTDAAISLFRNFANFMFT